MFFFFKHALLNFTCDSLSSTFALRLLGLQARTNFRILLLDILWTDGHEKPCSTDGESLQGVKQKCISKRNQGNFQIHFMRKSLSGYLATYCSVSKSLSPNRPKNIAAWKRRLSCVTQDLSTNTSKTLVKVLTWTLVHCFWLIAFKFTVLWSENPRREGGISVAMVSGTFATRPAELEFTEIIYTQKDDSIFLIVLCKFMISSSHHQEIYILILIDLRRCLLQHLQMQTQWLTRSG